MVDFKNPSKTFYTPEYKKILDIDDDTTFEGFLEFIHPEDRVSFHSKVESALKGGGSIEQYRLIKMVMRS